MDQRQTAVEGLQQQQQHSDQDKESITNNSNTSSTASRQYHHDKPPPLPPPSATMTEQKEGTTDSTTVRTEDDPPRHSNGYSPVDTTSSSSVRFSMANTTDSNVSSRSGNSSNKSGFTFRSGTHSHKRSMDLRQLPFDTSLFSRRSSKSMSLSSKKNKSPQGSAAVMIAPTASEDHHGDTHSQHDDTPVPTGGEQDPPVLLLDSSDNTPTDDDNDDDTDMDILGERSSTDSQQQHPPNQQQKRKRRRRKRRNKNDDKDDSIAQPKSTPTQESLARWCLRSTCLRSNFSLQSQLLLSFGIVSSVTIGIVMAICVAVSIVSGDKVHHLTRSSLEEFSYQMEGKIVRYVAEALSTQLLPDDIIQIVHDATVDRFVGYPNHPGYENDTLTPFTDEYSRANIYPVKGPAATLDWDLQEPVTRATAEEHVQHRFSLYQAYANVSTANAFYNFQGNCNPDATFGDYDWYKDCTEANNDFRTGGVVHPVETNQHLYQRASDLTPLFKAIYEDTPTLRDLGVCFANDGAGSCLQFPGVSINGTLSYVSEGCDWMKKPNPYKPSQPIGTPEMIRKCHPKGQIVYNREYNALERPWCLEQALDPESIHLVGPFPDAWNEDHQLMLVGKAVYDPLTKEFVGCTFMDFTIADVQEALKNGKVTENSHVTITRWDPLGKVAASSAWDLSPSSHTHSQQQQHKYEQRQNRLFDQAPYTQDLGIGVHAEDYQKLYEMVDYSVPWDPVQVRDTYASVIHHDTEDGYLVAASPMPPVPEEYDPDYRPQWLVIMSVSTEDVLGPVDGLQDYVNDKVESLVYFTLVAGLVGWGLMMVVIVVVSQALTLPLKSMNQATRAIVRNFGGNSEQGIDYNAPSNPVLTKCAPETEVSHVVCEFEKMVQKFSGSSKMAKAVQERFTELTNHFSFEHEFEELYQSRQEGSFPYSYDEIASSDSPTQSNNSSSYNPKSPGAHEVQNSQCQKRMSSQPQRKKSGSRFVHSGPIVMGSQSHLNLQTKKSGRNLPENSASFKGKRLTSPLFVWIVVFIVTPLLITTITMSAIVTYNVSEELTEVIDDGKAEYVEMEKFALKSAVTLRANWIAGQTGKSTRDLHIITRYASWLLFGGLDRRDSFTELTTGAEECKSESKPLECSYLEESPCDCSSYSKYGTCFERSDEHDDYSFRYKQEAYFVCESHDTMPDGDRNSSLSFPDLSDSPETTAWWSNATVVPGFEKGSAAKGYDTTYDRLRVLSAIPVFQTLYNYNSDQRSVLHSAVAMEADGMVVGYHGCALLGQAVAAFWQSTFSNHAHEMRPNLCPIGKYGYDPRCREWYDTGKKLAERRESELYVAAPYKFASGPIVGQTSTSPLLDPRTGEHVGQAFVDYRSDPIYNILSPNSTVLAKGGFPILISVREDRNGANTIVGPGVNAGDDTLQDIEDIILRNDLECFEPQCERHREEFKTILNQMKSGGSGNGAYSVRMDDGSDERMFIAYAPVNVKSYTSLDSSDFSRGVSEKDNAIYYLALTETEASLVAAFDQVEDDINMTIDIGIAILSIAIVLATFAVIYISYWVAISIAQPMLYLLELIRHINESNDDEVLVELDLQAGSLEVKNVANAMGTLHKIVKCANSAYFAGDVDTAFAVLTDAARLFKRLDNKKAMGVAYNNLGNTMLAMYRTMKGTGVEYYCGMTRNDIALKGMSYFHQAIQLGEKAYDEFYEAEGWSPSCLDFMQHLSNRYFNRAMFLLTVKDDHDNPKELEELGMRDLQIARDMDVEIIDQGTEVGWKVNTVEKLYNVALNRARGHLLLLEMGYPDDWDLEELLEDLFQSLKKELKFKLHTSDLFHELGPAGRMQQVETELMRYKVLKDDLETASKIAIRMLMEDEFILPDAQVKALEILVSFAEKNESKSHVRGKLALYESWLQRAKAGCDTAMASEEEEKAGEDVIEVVNMSVAKLNLSLIEMDSGQESSEDILQVRKSSLLATTRGDVTMEIF